MISERLQKLSARLREHQIEHALLSSLASLRYFTGHTSRIAWGPSPFTPLSGVLLWLHDEEPKVFLADSESTDDVHPQLTLQLFASYTVEEPLHAVQDLAAKLVQHLKGLPRSRVGIEPDELPAAVLEALRSACPQLEFEDVGSLLAEIRWIKDAEEIQLLRQIIELCDLGLELAKKVASAGMSELELFEEVRKGMDVKAGLRLPLMADIISGPRTAQIGGAPTTRKIQRGDLALVDLVPRLKGYWGDCCNTFAVGGATDEQQKVFAVIASALAEATERIRPGVAACDLDRLLRERVAKLGKPFPHHGGHGLGVTWHEEPRIVPYNQMPLQAGMVLALEPGIYFEQRWGMRLEHVVLVTETGAEVLAMFKHTL